MKPLKSQTATEYLIITAVVIIIALIVVNVLGGIPGLGSGISEQQARLILQTQTIGISDYAVSDYDTVFTLTNNHPNTVRIDTMSINGEQCLFFYGTRHQIRSGRSLEITCQNVYEIEDDTISWPIQINWTDISNDVSFTQEGDDVLLVGTVSNKYMNVLQSNDYWNGSIDGCYDDSENPIPICTCVDLNKTRDNLASNHTMQNSIDFNRCKAEFGIDFRSGEGWEPIGNDSNRFEATFDGRESVIANLFINRSSESSVGLFGDASNSNAVLENIGLIAVDVSGVSYVGGLLGYGTQAGVSNSYTTGYVNGSSRVGILVGAGGGSGISHSYATGSVTGYSYVGGLVGSAWGDIFDSFATGSVTSSVTGSFRHGGLVGQTHNLVSDSYATGSVIGDSQVGGLVGYLGGDVSGSYATGSVTGDGTVGGLLGYIDFGSDISHSYATGSVTSDGVVGGLFGFNGGSCTGTLTWINHSDDDADECVGSGSPCAGCTP